MSLGVGVIGAGAEVALVYVAEQGQAWLRAIAHSG